MATSVIDAFVMTLGLDPSGFKKGKAEADAGIKDTKNIAAAGAKEIGGAVSKMALEFTGLFLAIRSISDVVHFFSDLNHEIADLGYTSRQLGESASNLRLYQQISEGFGGSAKGVNDTVQGLESALFNMRQMGQFSDTLMAWQRFGGGLPPVNAQGGVDMLAAMKQARGAVHGLSPVEANQRLIAMGLDEGTRNAIMSSSTDLNKWIEAQRKSADEFAKNTQGAQRLSRSWQQMRNDTQGLAATLLSDATPALKELFTELDKWFKSDGPEHFRQGIDKIIVSVSGLVDGLAKLEKATPGSIAHGAWDWLKGSFQNPFGSNANKQDPFHNWESAGRRSTLAPLLSETEKKYSLRAGLLDRVISTESNYDTSARNGDHVGIMQLNSKNLKDFPNAGMSYKNDIDMGARYLAAMHKMFGGNEGDPDWIKAVESYNGGPGTTKGVLSGQKGAHFLPETLDYVPKVLGPGAKASGFGSGGITIGKIEIHSQATDADGIADDLQAALNRRFNVFQTDSGLV